MSSWYSQEDLKTLENISACTSVGNFNAMDDFPSTSSQHLNGASGHIKRRRVFVKEETYYAAQYVPNGEYVKSDMHFKSTLLELEQDGGQLVKGNRKYPYFFFNFTSVVKNVSSNCKILNLDVDLANDDTPLTKFKIYATSNTIEIQTDDYYLSTKLPIEVDINSIKASFTYSTQILNLQFNIDDK